MGTLRIRLEFDDPQVLSEAQISEGLRQSWVQLKPDHEIIFDVSSYIIHIFDLHESCPDGIVLSIDGFVLPPFESTYIINDKDVVRIQRKRDTSSETAGNLIEDEVAEKLPSSNGLLLSTGDDFEKDAGTETYEPEANEDNQAKEALLVNKSSDGHTISKKRKASRELQGSKKKRKCVIPEQLETEILTEVKESCPEEKRTDKKKKVSDRKKKSNRENSATRKKGSTKPEGSDDELVKPSDMPVFDASILGLRSNGTIKSSVRSSRRKREKRIWFQSLSKATREELAAAKRQRCQRRFLGHEVPNNAVEHVEEDSEEDGEMVPVVIRPGHFRFRRLKKSQAVQPQQSQGETHQGNGSTSRNGQEQRNDKKKRSTNAIDFDTLAPFTRLPKKGDVIAYRLLELNSTWTPELSPFRVGKTIWYNSQSHKLLLRPIRGHPIFFKKKADESECAQRSNSLYNEDGSLVTKYSSLIDVRLVKAGESEPEPENAVSDWFSDMKVSNGGTTSTMSESSKNKQASVVSPESDANPWVQNAQTASDKNTSPDGWEPWGNRSSSMQMVNAWVNASSGAPSSNGRGNGGSQTQPAKGWNKASASASNSKQSGYGRGNAGPRTQPGTGWNRGSGSKQPGNGRGNSGFRPQPAGGWGKPSSSGNGWGNASSGTKVANGWGNASSGTKVANGWGNAASSNQATNGWGNAGSGNQVANGWSKGSSSAPSADALANAGSGAQPANGWGNPGSGSAPASSGAPSGNDSGGSQPSSGWGAAANDWKKANSNTQAGNGWGNAGSGQPGNGWGNGGSRTEAPSSSTQLGNISGNTGSGTASGNGWGKPSTGGGKWSGKG